MKKIRLFLLLSATLTFSIISDVQIFAHGGEDHGDEKPTTAVADKGTIARIARIGEYEVMLKHSLLEPHRATTARFFVTKFETNEPVEKAIPAIEFESANGAVTEATIEKTDTLGSFVVKIPALPAGDYTVRAKLTYDGETDTATFSGVEVKPPPTATAEGEMSWARFTLIAFVSALVLAMLGGLAYFVWLFAGSKTKQEEVLSA